MAAASSPSLPELLRTLWLPELRQHPARHASALLAVMLGVALAFSVQLINASALAEFGAAVRSVNGEPDLELRADGGSFDEAAYALLALDARVAIASPVVEVETLALGADGKRHPLRVLGLDALVAPALAPGLLPRADDDAPRLAMLDPGTLFLNPAARAALGRERATSSEPLRVQSGLALHTLRDGGSVAVAAAPLAVIDIAGAQALFGRLGRLSRVDLRLVPGADAAAFRAEVEPMLAARFGPGLHLVEPGSSTQKLSNVSRAYRVNLTVLALVALFTGAFLVYSVLWLSVARRMPQFALLGVLGLAARERLLLVLAEAALLGIVGSVLGLALGAALASVALRVLGGDLGGGYFAGVAPALQWSGAAALAYGALGVLAALVGGLLPARAAQRLAPARALKGLGGVEHHAGAPWLGPALMAAGALLALAPPIAGLPLAAYASVALLLFGGIACVPLVVASLLPSASRRIASPLLLLAVERARHERSAATVAMAGVVASLSLAVALTVMVTSFRDAVSEWLDVVLPADLYVRSAAASGAAEAVWLPEEFVRAASTLPGVASLQVQRVRPLPLDPARPAPVLIARSLVDPARALPLVGELLPAREGRVSVYVSEAMVALYGTTPGSEITLPIGSAGTATAFVRGVWRDYARQQGAIAIAREDYVRLSGDRRVNDLAITLVPGAEVPQLQATLRALPGGDLLEFARADEIRAISLRIFDRSFAVTYWLQAVAIAIGLLGIAASVSAQVLARRREFGLLRHLGFTRAQVLLVVAGEAALWSAAGALLGLLLGIAVSVVLVHVVNPQSFHWTMELQLPALRLALLAAAVALAGTLSATLAARHAARQDAVLAVKEDW
ncbi:FtsX-like permease family protein [Rivibacter subsaxonicus]|uniref:Putative ABC transport system permease protein n=1 Tax=Rivibacter subsaxonicus TaxID=457575 RepID=A0A4Q7W2Y6_9BURK|nr:ABC transporter permease [Rivibacter subsaxonicus]RZU03149.1 putative ABC transport system permease protein [Rivibacter subsaxonicus]